jgi:hypothetical protein
MEIAGQFLAFDNVRTWRITVQRLVGRNRPEKPLAFKDHNLYLIISPTKLSLTTRTSKNAKTGSPPYLSTMLFLPLIGIESRCIFPQIKQIDAACRPHPQKVSNTCE